MKPVYRSLSNDPYYNIALEHQLFSETGGLGFYVWQNKPSVIIGRNQNIYRECDPSLLDRLGVLPVRRLTGGGAVYHDLGNVNFSFFNSASQADPEYYRYLICAAIRRLGIECEFSGRNDLLSHGRKFSGHAHMEDEGRHLYHGTIMVDVDFSRLSQSLTPSKLKLEAKGVESVRSRVINLAQLKPTLRSQDMIEALITTFQREGASAETIELNAQADQPPLMPKLLSHEWIFGQEPDFNVSFEKRCARGLFEVQAKVHDGLIGGLKIFSDSLDNLDLSRVEQALIGTIFDPERIVGQIEQFV